MRTSTSVISVMTWEAVCSSCGWSSGIVTELALAEQVADLHDTYVHHDLGRAR